MTTVLMNAEVAFQTTCSWCAKEIDNRWAYCPECGRRREITGTVDDIISMRTDPPVNLYPWGEYEGDPFTLHMGSNTTIQLEKAYGPLIFAGLRITAEQSTCEWVIEREWIADGSWHEIARIAGQVDAEFDREDDDAGPTD